MSVVKNAGRAMMIGAFLSMPALSIAQVPVPRVPQVPQVPMVLPEIPPMPEMPPMPVIPPVPPIPPMPPIPDFELPDLSALGPVRGTGPQRHRP